MMTNSKLLQEIVDITNESNETLREQLKQQILAGTSESNQNMLQNFSEKYHRDFFKLSEQFQHQNENLSEQIDNNFKQQNNGLISAVKQVIAESNQEMFEKFINEYNNRLQNLQREITERLDGQAEQILRIGKALSTSINNLQQDNSIIMETLQLILTNLLIDGVPKK